MGTSDFAVSCLNALHEAGMTPIAVVSQPDRPRGRGYVMTPTPVKARALELGIEVYTPENAKDGQLLQILQDIKADLSVVVAYGQILPKAVLDCPRYGSVNVHASLLPMYRGAAPINHVLMDGCTQTGITTIYMDEGIDTGDMILSALTDISDEDTFETLHDRLAQMGGNLLVETIRQIEAGTAPRIPQEGPTCYAHMLHTEDRRIDFNDTVKNIVNKVRGLSPVPCAFCLCEGKKVKIYRAADAGFDRDCPIGTVVCENGCLYVKARDGFVHIQQLQAEGKKRMDDQCFLCGNHPRQFE